MKHLDCNQKKIKMIKKFNMSFSVVTTIIHSLVLLLQNRQKQFLKLIEQGQFEKAKKFLESEKKITINDLSVDQKKISAAIKDFSKKNATIIRERIEKIGIPFFERKLDSVNPSELNRHRLHSFPQPIQQTIERINKDENLLLDFALFNHYDHHRDKLKLLIQKLDLDDPQNALVNPYEVWCDYNKIMYDFRDQSLKLKEKVQAVVRAAMVSSSPEQIDACVEHIIEHIIRGLVSQEDRVQFILDSNSSLRWNRSNIDTPVTSGMDDLSEMLIAQNMLATHRDSMSLLERQAISDPIDGASYKALCQTVSNDVSEALRKFAAISDAVSLGTVAAFGAFKAGTFVSESVLVTQLYAVISNFYNKMSNHFKFVDKMKYSKIYLGTAWGALQPWFESSRLAAATSSIGQGFSHTVAPCATKLLRLGNALSLGFSAYDLGQYTLEENAFLAKDYHQALDHYHQAYDSYIQANIENQAYIDNPPTSKLTPKGFEDLGQKYTKSRLSMAEEELVHRTNMLNIASEALEKELSKRPILEVKSTINVHPLMAPQSYNQQCFGVASLKGFD